MILFLPRLIHFDSNRFLRINQRVVFFKLIITLAFFSSCNKAEEPDLSIACAANMQFAMTEWVGNYEEQTGQKVQLNMSSSGKLFAQIREGAPWDLFFSADKKYPKVLSDKGFGQGKPRTYARGRLILLSRNQPIHEDHCAWLSSRRGKIAVANLKTAPYGEAAHSFLSHCGILDSLSNLLVFGESISQVNRFYLTETVDLALTAQSILYSDKLTGDGYHARVSNEFHKAIEQDYLVLRRTSEVNQFLTYIESDKGQAILKSYGYF